MKRLLLLCLGILPLAAAPKEVTIYLTSNLAGRFPLDQNLADNHMMRIASVLRSAKEKNLAAYHFDLGNAFYPGRLSRFSFGSITADYLQMLRLDAGIVAAADLNIGAESLEYIRRARGIRLVSANIMRDKSPLFEPFAILNKGGFKTAVIGITSARSLVSFEETQLLDLRLDPAETTLTATVERTAAEKPDLTIALTSVSVRDAVPLLSRNPRIDILICGGDAEAALGSDSVRAIELPDGRRVIAMPSATSLMKLTLKKNGSSWDIAERELMNIFAAENFTPPPPSFIRRMSLWQKWYAADEDGAGGGKIFEPLKLTPQFAAASVRDTARCDAAFVETGDVDTANFGELTRPRQVRYAVQNDYNIFSFRLSGAALRQFYKANPHLVFSGMSGDTITGYPIRDNVRYRVCATQRGYEFAAKQTEKRPPGESQWFGISDAVTGTIERGIQNPESAADSRFRLLTIFNLSNVYETGSVSNTGGIDTPPGQAATSYFKWGLENDVNFMFYNRRHHISLNPYIFYVRQNDQVIRNLLRGDLTYTFNTEWYIKPYQKNRIDTVVVADPVTGLKPSFLRETLGAEFSWKFFTGRLGAGLEKEILDPVNNPNWGFEATIAMLWEFYPGVKYKLGFDSFSSRTYQNFWRHRVDIANSLIFTIADPLTFTMSHRWYYFYLESAQNFYNASIFLMSLDLRTAWKYP
jgi:hypothetical protein